MLTSVFSCVAAGVTLRDIEHHLDRRTLKVTLLTHMCIETYIYIYIYICIYAYIYVLPADYYCDVDNCIRVQTLWNITFTNREYIHIYTPNHVYVQ